MKTKFRIVRTKLKGKTVFFAQRKAGLFEKWHFLHSYPVYTLEIALTKIPPSYRDSAKVYSV